MTIGNGVCDVTSNSSKPPKAKRNRFGAQVPYKWEKEAFLRDLDADPSLNSGTKAVTRVIAHNYDEERNQSVASVSYIAKATGMSVRAVKYNVPHVLTSFRASRLRKGIGTASSVWAVHWWCRGSSFIREKFGDVITDIRSQPVSSGANTVTSPKISGANDDTSKGDTDCTTKAASGATFAPNNIISPPKGGTNNPTCGKPGARLTAAPVCARGEVLKIVHAEVLKDRADTLLAIHTETKDGTADIITLVVESDNADRQEKGQYRLERLSQAISIQIEAPSDLIGAHFFVTETGNILPPPPPHEETA
ncbi:hypothetical protein EDF68_104114 [Ochrobactrum sp. BH3]|nr:hypothetical protein EDF68_104114 [Ochrobactrum sp. BH3]